MSKDDDGPKKPLVGGAGPTENPASGVEDLDDSSSTEGTADQVDLDSDDDTADAAQVSPQLADYNPEPVRDKLRGQIALYLIVLLAAIVVASFLHLYAAPWHSEKLVTILQILFGPITTLVGAATGYYFGANSGAKK